MAPCPACGSFYLALRQGAAEDDGEIRCLSCGTWWMLDELGEPAEVQPPEAEDSTAPGLEGGLIR